VESRIKPDKEDPATGVSGLLHLKHTQPSALPSPQHTTKVRTSTHARTHARTRHTHTHTHATHARHTHTHTHTIARDTYDTWTDTQQGEDYVLGSVADWVPPDGTVVHVRAVPEHRLPVWQRIILIGPLDNSLPFASLPSANRTAVSRIAHVCVCVSLLVVAGADAIRYWFGQHVTLQWCAIFSVRCAICVMARPFAFRSRAHAILTACTRM
jgi:hypothetical protein